MRHSSCGLLRQVLVAILTLTYSSGFASDETAQVFVEASPDSVQFDRLCEELIGQVLQRGSVRFAESSAELGSNSLSMLDEIVEIATDCPALSIAVTGHTDNTGNELANRELSKARAESVVAYLTEHGIGPERLTADGAGSATAIASNDDAAGRQVNRRIEFEVSH